MSEKVDRGISSLGFYVSAFGVVIVLLGIVGARNDIGAAAAFWIVGLLVVIVGLLIDIRAALLRR